MGGISINAYELNLTPDIGSGHLQLGASTISQPYGITEVDPIPFMRWLEHIVIDDLLLLPTFGDEH